VIIQTKCVHPYILEGDNANKVCIFHCHLTLNISAEVVYMMFKKLFNFLQSVFSDMILGHLARNAQLCIFIYVCFLLYPFIASELPHYNLTLILSPDSMSGKKMGQESSRTTSILRMVGLLCLLLFMIHGKIQKVNQIFFIFFFIPLRCI
jgi:hypothetical protein